MQTGGLVAYCGATVPSGYLLCDGSAVSRTTYADLFAVIGTAWGPGDGSSTFNLPDFRDRVPVGSSPGSLDASRPSVRTLGQAGGEETHQLTEAEGPSHTHTVNDPGHYHESPSGVDFAQWPSGAPNNIAAGGDIGVYDSGSPNVEPSQTGVVLNQSGSGDGHNTMQPFAVAVWLIKT